jgi:glycerol-1-phosphatase
VLADRYRAILLDLDGVVYRGDRPVPRAAEAISELRRAGIRVVFLTNNSARTPERVAERLRALGVAASPDEVVTSAQATASLVAREAGGDGRTAFVIGEEGVRSALGEAGIEVLDGQPDRVGFVVVGWDRWVDYDKLRTASVLVGRGARLVATNQDASYPAPGGDLWPGAGALVAAVETASGSRALVVGKPGRPLFDEALERAGTRRALMVGDRVETDVAGADAAGIDSALVLTGASRRADLLDLDAQPVAILRTLDGLLQDHPLGSLRAAREDDMAGVRSLTRPPPQAASWGPEGVWVIEEDGLLATATADVRGQDAYLRAVATREDIRGRDLATRVVAGSVRDASRRGATACFLLTEAAEPFFRGLGFGRVSREKVPSWALELSPECPASAAAMSRELPQ